MYIYTNSHLCYYLSIMDKVAFYIAPLKRSDFIMATTKAGQKAVNKYVKNNYDRINVTFPKGKKEIIKAAADARGVSVNKYITAAVDAQIDRDTPSDPQKCP